MRDALAAIKVVAVEQIILILLAGVVKVIQKIPMDTVHSVVVKADNRSLSGPGEVRL